jgi:hypothetical protein
MSYDPDSHGRPSREGASPNRHYDRRGEDDQRRYRDEIYSRRIPAGKRTYFFDVKSTRSGDDFFITITESKRIDEGRYEKHKLFLYKEDFGKFIRALHEVVQHIQDDCLPEHDFSDLPDLLIQPDSEEAYDDDY